MDIRLESNSFWGCASGGLTLIVSVMRALDFEMADCSMSRSAHEVVPWLFSLGATLSPLRGC